MKGVSEVISIILVLMIVIALAALAYTWFSGVFSGLTSTAGTSITTTSQTMNTQFSFESVKQPGCTGTITAYIRNVGTQTISLGTLNAYTSDGTPLTCSGGTCTQTIKANALSTAITLTGTPTGSICTGTSPNAVCYYNNVPQSLRFTFSSGLESSTQITC